MPFQKGIKNPRFGKKLTENEKKKLNWTGKHHTEESKRKMSLTKKEKKQRPPIFRKYGKENPNWKGGISEETHLVRTSAEYKLWRIAVFERDNYTCIWCGDNKGGNLEADHIQLFSTHPDLRFAIDNGRTLCKNCHIKRHSSK